MDTTTTKETEVATEVATAEATATETKKKERTLRDEIRYFAIDVDYIERSVDEGTILYEDSIEKALFQALDLKNRSAINTTEWRMAKRLMNRIIDCLVDVRHKL